ncbi:MAG: hypothetical protein Q4D87_06010 [Actinomycetaceae bacterium]|nr:hypothetical protein [Actinomycetaceae bacterium]
MSCYALPGESRSQLWSTRKIIWVALAFLTAFVGVFSTGSIFEDAAGKPAHLMFATVVALALIGVPLIHREWAFGRRTSTVLIAITWLVATVTFIRSFAPLTEMASVSVGFPRGLLFLLAIGAAYMAWKSSPAKWPELPEDATGDQWSGQLRALLNRYYSWPAGAADDAVMAALEQAADAGMTPMDALGQPWEVAAEFAAMNPDNSRLSIRFPVWAGLGFIALSVASIALNGISAIAVLFGVMGAIMLAFAWWASKQ